MSGGQTAKDTKERIQAAALEIRAFFIVPSREERIRLNMPNAEYGTTIRMYCPDKKNWQVCYNCVGEYTRVSGIEGGITYEHHREETDTDPASHSDQGG